MDKAFDKPMAQGQDFTMQTVILAGGLGTRLHPMTENFPKSMIEIGGKPFLDYQIRHLLAQKIEEIVLITGFHSRIIEDYVSTQDWASQVRIVNEGDQLRGTGGALLWAEKHGVLWDRFLLLYGDSFLPIDFQAVSEAFVKSGCPALMTLLRNEGAWDASNVIYQNGVIELYDKRISPKPPEMKYIDYGLLGLTKDFVRSWSHRSSGSTQGLEKFDLADPLTALSKLKKLAGYLVNERFYEVGSFQGIEDFKNLVNSPRFQRFF